MAEFALPPELFNLQGHSGLMHQAEPGRFFDNQPLPPGQSQLSFSFELDARQFDGELRICNPGSSLDGKLLISLDDFEQVIPTDPVNLRKSVDKKAMLEALQKT